MGDLTRQVGDECDIALCLEHIALFSDDEQAALWVIAVRLRRGMPLHARHRALLRRCAQWARERRGEVPA